ncbi:MAG: hypothetical protein JRK26_27295 [Deltaproteobacteria bacterium]|nr:hypothetical protein [Deltaproteobacteria bacterium]
MEPLRVMVKFYLMGEPITAWALMFVSVLLVFISFFSSKDNKGANNRYDRFYLMAGVFTTVALLMLWHFFGKNGSENAIELIREAYKYPALFK